MSASAISPSVLGRSANLALVERELEAVDQFVARVLRRAHDAAESRNAPSEARAVLEVAHLFADELSAGDPGFDRIAFVAAATDGPS
jgi:hypothetical protein